MDPDALILLHILPDRLHQVQSRQGVTIAILPGRNAPAVRSAVACFFFASGLKPVESFVWLAYLLHFFLFGGVTQHVRANFTILWRLLGERGTSNSRNNSATGALLELCVRVVQWALDEAI